MKKLIFTFTVLMSMAVMLVIGVAAEEAEIQVELNGDIIAFTAKPAMDEGKTLVPIRTLAESLGGQVSWDAENQYIIAVFDAYEINMKVDVPSYVINGNAYVMEKAPVLMEGRVMVPLRETAEIFGCEVQWDETSRTVGLYKEGVVLPEVYKYTEQEPTYSEEDLLWLARIVHVEGYDISYEAKLAIANVVLNRVKGNEYPNTVYDVIMDRAYTVQFPPAHKAGFTELDPSEESIRAAKDALEGINNIEDCLYFNNRPFKWKSDDLYTVIEGEYFYR